MSRFLPAFLLVRNGFADLADDAQVSSTSATSTSTISQRRSPGEATARSLTSGWLRWSSRHRALHGTPVRRTFLVAPTSAKASLLAVWPISLPPPSPRLVYKDVDWSKYALPDRPTLKSDAERWRAQAAQSEHDAECDRVMTVGRRRDDEAAPLLAAPANGARSSGFLSSFSGLLRHRSPQAV